MNKLLYYFLIISTRINKPLLPTFNDIAKQTRLQQLVSNI